MNIVVDSRMYTEYTLGLWEKTDMKLIFYNFSTLSTFLPFLTDPYDKPTSYTSLHTLV
jgi:hypothetical protein